MNSHTRIIREEIVIDESVSSKHILNKYTATGICEDNTIYLQSSVHGAELQGNLVIKEILNYLKNPSVILKAKLIAIPLANPYASSVKIGSYTYGRFNPITGDNWNRLYHNLASDKKGPGVIDYDKFICELKDHNPSSITNEFKKLITKTLDDAIQLHNQYGISENKKLFLSLQTFAANADMVLDLHTGPVATSYLYAPEFLKDKSRDTNSPNIIIIPNEFAGAMDEASFYPWYVLSEKLKAKNISYELKYEAYTVELCSEEFVCHERAKREARRLINLLINRGYIEDKNFNLSKDESVQKINFCALENYVTYRAKKAGLYEYLLKSGESYNKGDKLMRLHRFDNLEQQATTDDEFIYAQEDGVIINHTPSSNIKLGMDLMQCFKLG